MNAMSEVPNPRPVREGQSQAAGDGDPVGRTEASRLLGVPSPVPVDPDAGDATPGGDPAGPAERAGFADPALEWFRADAIRKGWRKPDGSVDLTGYLRDAGILSETYEREIRRWEGPLGAER